jgi:hypothetical protein
LGIDTSIRHNVSLLSEQVRCCLPVNAVLERSIG